MEISTVMSIFGRTINNLQLCQCVRDREGYAAPRIDRLALERVIIHCIYSDAVPASANKSYGDGIKLNDLLPAYECEQCGEEVSELFPVEHYGKLCAECRDKEITRQENGPTQADIDDQYSAGESSDMKYRADMKDAGRGHLLR